VSGTEEARRLLANITPGPWRWFGSMKHGQSPYLASIGRGRQYVMTFARNGMQGAQPRFQDQTTHMMVKARDLAIYEVCPDATDENDPRLYRHDITGFRNADAEFIAAAPRLVASLAATLEAVAALHIEDPSAQRQGWCEHCGYSWPCPTARLVSPEPAEEGQ
jgi:hypothetical protein